MIMVLVLGSEMEFGNLKAIEKKFGHDRKLILYNSLDVRQLRGVNLDDVLFLKDWKSHYKNIPRILQEILPCLRGEHVNPGTIEKISFALGVLSWEMGDPRPEEGDGRKEMGGRRWENRLEMKVGKEDNGGVSVIFSW
jgi:hypothetical protein